jgi:hypothetical protein
MLGPPLLLLLQKQEWTGEEEEVQALQQAMRAPLRQVLEAVSSAVAWVGAAWT